MTDDTTDDTTGTAIEPAGATHSTTATGAAPGQTDIKEYMLLLPRLLKLVWRLARDPRVPARTKATLFLLGGYLVSPIDVIPDFIPGIGQLDDIAIIAFVLDQMLNRLPEDVVSEHWDGDEDLLQIVKEIVDISTAFVPGWLRNRFGA